MSALILPRRICSMLVSSANTTIFYDKCTRCSLLTNNTRIHPEQTRALCDIQRNYDNIVDKNSKLIITTLKSLRADIVLKAGLGLARNKTDPLFYHSKIRLNGAKMLKKSVLLKEGDEIDVIKGVSDKNQNYITVSRVEVLETNEQENNVKVKLRICKNLTVDNSDNKP